VKHGLGDNTLSASVRAATPLDVPAIVAMGAESQKALCKGNARMWTPHPDAPARFGAWMHYSLTSQDRRIFVAGERELGGFVIAQPTSPFHLPLASRSEHVGLIDDFWSSEFAEASDSREMPYARDLLASAEGEFVQRGRTSAMVVCPAAWRAKQDLLRACGYRDGNAWMLKV
jgi:hypothetical protein